MGMDVVFVWCGFLCLPPISRNCHLEPAWKVEKIFLKKFILEQKEILSIIPKDVLLEQRYLKFRRMGKFAETAWSFYLKQPF